MDVQNVELLQAEWPNLVPLCATNHVEVVGNRRWCGQLIRRKMEASQRCGV